MKLIDPHSLTPGVCYSLRNNHLEELDHGQVRRELHQALAVWSKDSNLTFREVNSDDADILVKFHRSVIPLHADFKDNDFQITEFSHLAATSVSY